MLRLKGTVYGKWMYYVYLICLIIIACQAILYMLKRCSTKNMLVFSENIISEAV